jgi:hypothetical protein
LSFSKYTPKVYENQKYAIENGQPVNIMIMDLLGESLGSEFKA